MLLLQRDDYRYVISCIISLLIFTPTITLASNSNDTQYPRKIINIKTLINKSTLECSFNKSSEDLVRFYESLQNRPYEKIGHEKFYIGEDYILNGVKLISDTYKKRKNEKSVNMDTDFKKLGVKVLRVSSFIQDGEYESFGYYIILKNKPSANRMILQEKGINTKYSTVEETVGSNTRIKCILVGWYSC